MGNVRLYIDDVEIPLLDDVSLPVTYSIEEIRTPDKTSNSYAETIELASTKELESIFEFIFETNVDLQSFNPNLKTPVRIEAGSTQTFRGSLKLVKAIRNRRTRTIKYICDFIGEKADLFYNIGEKYMTGNDDPADDLDFSGYDHTLSSANVTGSWSTATNAGAGYVYGFADYGMEGSGINGGNDTVFYIHHFRPSLFVRELLESIFTAAGKTWTSTFLDGNFFKGLVISCNQALTIPTATFNNRKMLLTLSNGSGSSGSINAMTYSWGSWGSAFVYDQQLSYSVNSPAPFNDAGGMYNLFTDVVTIPANDDYTISVLMPFSELRITNIGATNGPPDYSNCTYDYEFTVHIQKWDGAAWINIAASPTYSGTVTAGSNVVYTSDNFGVSYTGYFVSGDLIQLAVDTKVDNLYLKNGGGAFIIDGTTTYDFVFFRQTSGGFNILPSYSIQPTDNYLNEGETVEVNQALPQNLKQKDFLKAIIQAFNLYIYEDKDTENNYIIEPRRDFYSGTVRDWTNRVDVESEEETLIMGELDAKRYTFKFSEDADYFNKIYSDNWGRVSGYKQYVVENQFLVNENETELIFAPTMLTNNFVNGLIIPSIYKSEGGVITPQSFKTRLWYWGGSKNVSFGFWNFKTVSGDNYYSTYPYVGPVDDPYTPTFDLNFGVPKEIYVTGINSYSWPTSNLFTEYWEDFLALISNPNSKIVRLKVFFDEIDIKLFDFREPVVIDGTKFVVNLIEDFDATDKKSITVEFLKI